jgi:hypothetical protein
MNWSERKATRAGHKLPQDWEAQCKKSFMCLAHDIKEHDIPAELHVNTDQAQGVYVHRAVILLGCRQVQSKCQWSVLRRSVQ